MIERALVGGQRYRSWLLALLGLSLLAPLLFVTQLREGLTITAMSQDMPWGFYIAQLTFLVGVAASAVMAPCHHLWGRFPSTSRRGPR